MAVSRVLSIEITDMTTHVCEIGYNKKNPTTVGGRTIGSVKTPSSAIFIVSFLILIIPQATIKPKKKVINIDKLAVFIEIKMGDQSVMSNHLLFILNI